MRVSFTAYGIPAPQARPRRVMLPNGKMVTYSPRSRTGWEQAVRIQALQHRPERLLDGPLALVCRFYLPRPKSAPKRRRWPDRRPDLDNLEKTVLDVLTGLVWTDDARICQKLVGKLYGDPPRVEVEVWELEG